MKLLDYLELGESVLPAAEKIFAEAEPLIDKLVEDGKKLAHEAEALFDEAEAAFENLKANGVAGTDVGKVASTFAADVTTAYANAKQLVGNDAAKVLTLVDAAEAQLKLLAAQLSAGLDVTKAS